MPTITKYYTNCAQPGIAHEFSSGGAILTLIATGGIVGYLLWKIAGLPCHLAAAIIGGLLAGVITVIDGFLYWYYNERLMCIQDPTCVIGTVAGFPYAACDGDVKIDLLIAPYGYLEVEVAMSHEALKTLSAADPTFPAPPVLTDYASNRPLRLEYVNGTIAPGATPQLASGARLNEAQRKRLYLELVHNVMFRPPGPGETDRRFQKQMYVRDQVAMGNDAYTNSPDDQPTAADPNPMFRYEKDPDDENAIGSFFCEQFLGKPGSDRPEDRMVPYLHCEIEGDRLSRALNNLKLSIVAFFGAYLAICLVCHAIPVVGQVPWLCELVAAGLAFLFAWLIWLLSKLFNDPDDGEAGAPEFNPPDVSDPASPDDVGDLVLVRGRWIMDTEHFKYFEIHPVTGWYRIAMAPGGDPRLIDNPGQLQPGEETLTASDIDRSTLAEMCRLAASVEGRDPDGYLTKSTAGMLSVGRGLS